MDRGSSHLRCPPYGDNQLNNGKGHGFRKICFRRVCGAEDCAATISHDTVHGQKARKPIACDAVTLRSVRKSYSNYLSRLNRDGFNYRDRRPDYFYLTNYKYRMLQRLVVAELVCALVIEEVVVWSGPLLTIDKLVRHWR